MRCPAAQRSCVHWLPSMKTSVSSTAGVMPPLPSQTLWWQSPAVWAAIAVPAGVGTTLQIPSALHARVWHSVSGPPGQSLAELQPTHAPAPSQNEPPLSLHGVPCVSGMCVGAFPVHRSCVHPLASIGRSVGSVTVTMFPVASHWLRWQSPAVCVETAAPLAARLSPHTPAALQVRERHSVSAPPGHWPALLHCTHASAPAIPLQRVPIALAAGGVLRLGRIRRDTVRAQVLRALIAVDRQVGVVGDRHDVARGVALVALAVARHLGRNDRARGRVGDDALPARRAAPLLAGGVHARTVGDGDAADARAAAVADQTGPARGARRSTRGWRGRRRCRCPPCRHCRRSADRRRR